MNDQEEITLELDDSNVSDEVGEEIAESIEEQADNADDELTKTKAELESLKRELQRRDELEAASSRMNRELSEFEDYFPEVGLFEIPDEIWQKVKTGASLAASFALFKRKNELEKRKIDDFNKKNRKMSSGALMQGGDDRYFSPAEVKKMSPAEVKRNYDDIIESMRHWN